MQQNNSHLGRQRLSPSHPQTPARDLSNAAKRLSSSGQSPIGSERGASPASMASKLAGSVSTVNSNLGYAHSDDSLPARESSSRHSPASSTVPSGAEDLAASGHLDPSDQEGMRARRERQRLEHERQRALQRQAFEEQMKRLELQQREEEASLMRQDDGSAGDRQLGRQPTSAPLSGPETYQNAGAFRASAGTSPTHLGSGLSGHNDTEDGLNGSNVPGLPPLNSMRSVPATRQGSHESSFDAQTGSGDKADAAKQRDNDLVNAFGRINVGSKSSSPSASAPPHASQPSSGAGFQKLLSRTGVDLPQGISGDSGTTGMTPVFNERFLFDDELDAEDSAFVRKYNLSGDDDKFPILRDDRFSETSAASKPKSGTGDSRLSEWPPFDSRRREVDANADRRGQSERNSPRGNSAISRPSPLAPPSGAASGPFARHGSIGPGHGPFGPGAGLGQTLRGSPAPGAGGPRRSVGAHPGDRSGSFPAFSMESSANRLGPFQQGPFGSGPGSEEATSRPTSGFFQAFGNGSGVNSAFAGFGALPSEDLTHGDLTGRKGELDVNTRLEDLKGEIFSLCKDQHGCRYLQKKLEEGVPTYRDMIFAETFSHFAELMTDPFGNYLCQKMLEFCTDEQRNLIVEDVSSELVTISLNMHGTRAVQKTIDFLSTSRQIHSIIDALSMNVVTLIKDLNGNHVIQKCLNRLGPEDNQFIYNAVAAHCVEVATHRHGCCVLQRCVDHASDKQRVQLVQEITYNALVLVQDPFGNYVVQYILDLNDARFTEAVVRQFVGNVCLLSVQKFSSNVIEKCIRVCGAATRRQLVEELLNRARLEKLLRDSFANYVVQTALDYSDPIQRGQLVDCIRPILPMIRNTPYGKRIQSKLQRETFDSNSMGHGQIPYQLLQAAAQQQHFQAMATMGRHPMDYPGMGMYGNAGGPGIQGQNGMPVTALPPPHQIYGATNDLPLPGNSQRNHAMGQQSHLGGHQQGSGQRFSANGSGSAHQNHGMLGGSGNYGRGHQAGFGGYGPGPQGGFRPNMSPVGFGQGGPF